MKLHLLALGKAKEEAPLTENGFDQLQPSFSPDGKRLVDITGDGQAFLYDKTEAGAPKFMKYLGNGAQGVRFSGGTGDEPLRVMLELKGGGFALFDGAGARVEISKAAQADAPPDTPDEIPPPPESSPGD